MKNTTYAQAKAQQTVLDTAHKLLCSELHATRDRLANELGVQPTGAMGLTTDCIRINPEYRAAKIAADRAFEALRAFNAAFTRQFKKELREERRARDLERQAR